MIELAGSSSDVPFERFYSALNSWKHFTIVASPADADLELYFHVDAGLLNAGSLATYQLFLTLTVFDTKTHSVLWKFNAPLPSRLEKTVNNSVAQLLNSFENLLTSGGANAPR